LLGPRKSEVDFKFNDIVSSEGAAEFIVIWKIRVDKNPWNDYKILRSRRKGDSSVARLSIPGVRCSTKHPKWVCYS
jgi:hypothetical protein